MMPAMTRNAIAPGEKGRGSKTVRRDEEAEVEVALDRREDLVEEGAPGLDPAARPARCGPRRESLFLRTFGSSVAAVEGGEVLREERLLPEPL